MQTRRFHAFFDKNDLIRFLTELQRVQKVYYVPTYSVIDSELFDDLVSFSCLGINTTGNTTETRQFLIFPSDVKCVRKTIDLNKNNEIKTSWMASFDGNSSCVLIQPGGVYNDNAIFPTIISTMCYDNSVSKKLYDKIKRLAGKNSAKALNGWYIGYSAYEQRKCFRFCPVSINAPLEYDLKVE